MMQTQENGTIELSLPANWASFLVNGDKDAYSKEELEVIASWKSKENLGACLFCSDEAFFSWGNDHDASGGDCLNFTFNVH